MRNIKRRDPTVSAFPTEPKFTVFFLFQIALFAKSRKSGKGNESSYI